MCMILVTEAVLGISIQSCIVGNVTNMSYSKAMYHGCNLCLFCTKELGPDMIQKMRGYSEHLIRLVRHEECELTVHTVHYTRVRHLSTALSMTATELCDSSSSDSSSSDSCPPHTDSILQVLSRVTTDIPGMHVIMSSI